MATPAAPPLVVGRYALYDKLASGGMASVHVARILGDAGFSRTVAIKRLHPQYASDPDFAAMFVDEARLAARIRHPNVVPTLDVVSEAGELFLVMDYVEGEALSQLLRLAFARGESVSVDIAVGVIAGALHGLHAAHEAKNEQGEPLGIVHRDVSPQNIMVGTDGIPRVLDFGVAKAMGQLHTTREGQVKGKLAYLAPEQIQGGHTLTRQVDVFAAGVVLWETLCGERLFAGDNEGATIERVLRHEIPLPSKSNPKVPRAIDTVVMRALERDVTKRFATAQDMADALESAVTPASARRIGDWAKSVAGERIAKRAASISDVERSGPVLPPSPSSGSFPQLTPAEGAVLAMPPAPPPAPPQRSALVPVLLGVTGIAIAIAVVAVVTMRDSPSTAAAPSATVSTTATSVSSAIASATASAIASAASVPSSTLVPSASVVAPVRSLAGASSQRKATPSATATAKASATADTNVFGRY